MKNILFISTTFNLYYLDIISEMKKLNCNVDWFSDRPSNSIIMRAAIRVNKNIVDRQITKYEKKILKYATKKIYDTIFVILGQSFHEEFWVELKKIQAQAKFIYYLWDSVANFPCITNNAKYFDKVYSFDKQDCQTLECEFLPLFYVSDFAEKKYELEQYDFCYIGTFKPDRYSKINEIIHNLEIQGMKGYVYFYIHSRSVRFYYRMKYKNIMKNVNHKLFYKRLSKKECSSLEHKSKIIIDVPQEHQNGLTIRIFEAMALRKKIITTNEDIVNYDFYYPQNIYVAKDGKINFDDIFFGEDFKNIDENIYNKYSLKQWVKKVLGVEN